MTTKLWKYNKTTGYWNMVRVCAKETAEQWLHTFTADEPDQTFVLSTRKPSLPKSR